MNKDLSLSLAFQNITQKSKIVISMLLFFVEFLRSVVFLELEIKVASRGLQ